MLVIVQKSLGLVDFSKRAAFILFAMYLVIFGIRKFDFHPDESIYLSLSRLSTWSASGFVFTDLYSWTLSTRNPALYARLVSAVCGLTAAIFAIKLFKDKHSPDSNASSFARSFLPFCLLIPFWITMLRVRPEASILTLFIIILFLTTRKKTRSNTLLLFALSALLVNNHSISLIVAALLCLYLAINRKSKTYLPYLVFGTLLGLFLNGPVRFSLVNGRWNSLLDIQIFGADNSLIPISTGVEKSSLTQILNLMFRGGPFYISDQVGLPSIWKLLFGHLFVEGSEYQNSLNHIVISSIAPLIYLLWTALKGTKVFMIATAPYFIFFLLGYFNPTYSSFIFLISFFLSYTLHLDNEANSKQKNVVSYTILSVFFVVTMLNSISFVTTRLIPYGSASYFKMEPYIYDQINNNPDSNILVSERYGAILSATGLARNYEEIVSRTIYKSGFVGVADFSKVNLLILDSTDFLMYGKPLESIFQGQIYSVNSVVKRLHECESDKYEVVPSNFMRIRKFNSTDEKISKSIFMGIGDVRSTRYMKLDCEKNR